MADNKGQKKKNGNYEVKTSTSFQTYEFRWTVENFPQWPNTFKETSEEFQPAKDIILYALFERFVDGSVDKCYMRLISKGMSFKMKYSFLIVGSDGKINFESLCNTFTFDEEKKKHDLIILPNKIIEFSNSAKDDIVIFKWVLEISALTTKNVCSHRPQSQISSHLLPTIIKDFKSMFSDSLYTDLTLLVGNSVIRVHKSVLCARSPVFAKMLESPMDEKEKDVITISDIDLPILKTFIEFLYSGDMPEAEFKTACDLYYAADKYEVPRLQRECAIVLLNKLDVENSCQVLALANRHSDQELKDSVLHFMQSEFDAILGTDSWMDFVKVESDLAVEVMKLRAQMFEERSSS